MSGKGSHVYNSLIKTPLRCSKCGRRPRVKGRTQCHDCLSRVYTQSARRTWKRRKVVSRALGGHTEAPPEPGPFTPPDLEKLFADVEAAAERALKLAATLAAGSRRK